MEGEEGGVVCVCGVCVYASVCVCVCVCQCSPQSAEARVCTELRRANFACGVTQAPRRVFNCASVFAILIKSARPHPLYLSGRIDFIGLAASGAPHRRGAIRGRLSVQKLSQAPRRDA